MLKQHVAFIALGANVGERERHLQRAVSQLHQSAGIQVSRVSSIYETDPVGVTDQPLFLNMVIEVLTSLDPYPLFKRMMVIEQASGRRRVMKWGPRTLDLDLLLYDQLEMDTDVLTIPHPRMWERNFVMVPLLEIMPGMIVNNPGGAEDKGVRLWKAIDWETVFALSVN